MALGPRWLSPLSVCTVISRNKWHLFNNNFFFFFCTKRQPWISFHACGTGKSHPACPSVCFGPNFLFSGKLIWETHVSTVMWYHRSCSLHFTAFMFFSHTHAELPLKSNTGFFSLLSLKLSHNLLLFRFKPCFSTILPNTLAFSHFHTTKI